MKKVGIAVVCVCGIAAAAGAQPQMISRDAGSLSRWYGSLVILVDKEGRETTGRLVRVDSGEFLIESAGEPVTVPVERVTEMLAPDRQSVAGSMLKWTILFGAAGDLLVNRCIDHCSARQEVMSATMVVAGALYGRTEALRRRRQRRQLYVAPGAQDAAWPELIAPGDELPGPALLARIRPGDFVFVTDAEGAETAGSVRAIDDHSIAVAERGRGVRRLRAEEVVDVQRLRGDRDWDGLLFGAVFGTVSGLVIGDTCGNPGVGTCKADGWDTSGRGRATGAFWQACVYGGIGYLLDRSSQHERIESLYRVKPARARRIEAAPAFGRGRTSLHVRVSF
jgi:hypothetical protein